jgi:hypothetical protein
MRKALARRQKHKPDTVLGYGVLSLAAHEGGRKIRLSGELRRKDEQWLYRTRVCVDREGTVDDMSEG